MAIKSKITRPKGCDPNIKTGMKIYASKNGEQQARWRGKKGMIQIGWVIEQTENENFIIALKND